MPSSPRSRHISFPRQTAAKRLVDLGAKALCRVTVEREATLPEEAHSFVEWLFGRVNLDVSAYRAETLSRRLTTCLRTLRVASLADARRLLDANPALVGPAAGAMLVGVTSFFRDPEVFDAIARDVLPPLIAGRGGLYVWSAGCSGGAELYSIAMLLAELGVLHKSYLFGTDCRADAVEEAKAGTYPATLASLLPAALRDRYLVMSGGRFTVIPELARATRWRVADVLTNREPGIWDMILFRNTAIYMRSAASEPLWSHLEASLRTGGALVLGKAERPAGTKRLAVWASCVFRKVHR